jgi:hypothetical protein
MTRMTSPPRTANPFQFSLGWLLAYITVIAMVCAGVTYGRREAFRVYGTEQAQEEWFRWRIHVDLDQTFNGGPVQRRIPKSTEPPALVLMRDYFWVCLGGALLLSTVLFGTFMVLVRGALSSAPGFVDRTKPTVV